MYSVMLAAMLTTTSATPEWGCHGCYGCSGSYGCNAFSCAGTCYGCGCHSYSCYGCSCSGCSCYGCSCSGCSGFCSGSYLGGPRFDSVGCSACHGGAYFSAFSCHGSYSCSCSGCYGCCGGCCGGAIVSPPAVISGRPAPSAAADSRTKVMEEEIRALKEQNRELKEMIQRMGPGKPGGGGKPGKPEQTSEPAPAHVVVKLPDDARLFVDDKACPLTSAKRSFDTPSLKPGQTYYYTLRAEVTRDGRPLTESKRVTLRAGEESVVEFGNLEFVQTAGR